MRPDGVVVPPPSFGQDLRLGQRVENLLVQQFITHRAVEGLAVAILPWAAGCDVERLHADPSQCATAASSSRATWIFGLTSGE